jgi:two-component system sensor histidine kinase KdpD
MARGVLRIYLGASPGVGKTYKMLGEGVRRKQRGTDVVVGVVLPHGRRQTEEQIRDLEVVPPRVVAYRGTTLEEMDVDAIITRRPRVVLVDEYAHTNAPGSKNDKRWQDVEELLGAGIDVISTLNIQHLESLNDVVSQITGSTQRETVPDDVVRRADQLELVDMSPEAIRRRMAHGNIYPAERVDAALANYFRVGNLSALRELALLWLADRVEDSLQSYLAAHDVSGAWETRERVVVGITGRPGGDALIRRAARMAGRVGGELIGVHVAVNDGLAGGDGEELSAQRRLIQQLGGVAQEIVGHDTAESLAAFARREKATQMVLGASDRGRWWETVHGSFLTRVSRLVGDIDLHVVARSNLDLSSGITDRAARSGPSRRGMERRRVVAAIAFTVIGLPLLTLAGVYGRQHVTLPSVLLLALAYVLLIAAIGGRIVAVFAALAASLLVNWYFVVPYHSLKIAEFENLTALIVFVVVAVGVGWLVDVVWRRAAEARTARAEAAALARSTTALAGDPNPLPPLLDMMRATFALEGVEITGQTTLLSGASTGPVSAELTLSSNLHDSDSSQLRVYGRRLTDDDLRLLRVFADQLSVALDNERLVAEAREAATLAAVDAVRTALLRAVSHDLRTPLASIKAMISGLRDPSVAWSASELSEALRTVEEETDRLNQLVGNLLDASRVQAGAVAVEPRSTVLPHVIASAVESMNAPPGKLSLALASDLPLVLCDSALLERSLANVISNALRHSPPRRPVRIEADPIGATVHVRVIDRGVGIPAAERAKALLPFQRLGDGNPSTGVGLGLAIARGFVTAMSGELLLDDTPGGGLTVTIILPVATAPVPERVLA